MRQPHQPPLPNTTLQIGIAPKTEPLVVVCAYGQAEREDRLAAHIAASGIGRDSVLAFRAQA